MSETLTAAEKAVMETTFKAAMLRAADIIDRITDQDVTDAQLVMHRQGVKLHDLTKRRALQRRISKGRWTVPDRDPKLSPIPCDALRKADKTRTVLADTRLPLVSFRRENGTRVMVWLKSWRKWAKAAEVVRIGSEAREGRKK